MDWENFRAFIVASRHGTLTATAKSLRVSIATVARRLDAIEAELCLKLIDRTAQGLTVTPIGRALLGRAGAGEHLLADVERLAAALRRTEARNPVRVSATEPVIGEILAPHLPILLQRAPDVVVDLVVDNSVVSLALRDADIAIRLARPEGDSLIARRLPPLRMGVYASLAYLADRGTIVDLHDERIICYDQSYGWIPELRWIEEQGLENRIVMRTSSSRGIFNAVVAGAGIGLLPELLAKRDARLVQIPVSNPVPPRAIWLVWHRDLKGSVPLRKVRDWIVASFAASADSRPY